MTTIGPGDSTVLILPLRGGGEDGLAEAFEEIGDAVEAGVHPPQHRLQIALGRAVSGPVVHLQGPSGGDNLKKMADFSEIA